MQHERNTGTGVNRMYVAGQLFGACQQTLDFRRCASVILKRWRAPGAVEPFGGVAGAFSAAVAMLPAIITSATRLYVKYFIQAGMSVYPSAMLAQSLFKAQRQVHGG